MITISHSFAEGTLIEGTRRGDGTYELLRGLGGWKWLPSLNTFGVPRSRDHMAKEWLINSAVTALRTAGYEVADPEIDNTPRPMVDREADRAARVADRADRLSTRAERDAAGARAANETARRMGEVMQGEPMKPDHHSYSRHRRDVDRVNALDRRSWNLDRSARHAAEQAAIAAEHMARREDPPRTVRRIERLEADRREAQRTLDGHVRNFRDAKGEIVSTDVSTPATGDYRDRLLLHVADVDEQLDYWRALLERARMEGRYNPVDVAAIKPGDAIRSDIGWDRVTRVNKTTITVQRPAGWNNKVKISAIVEHRALPIESETS